jgi:cupin-like protein
MRDVPLRDRGMFNLVFFLQHWFPRSTRLRRRREVVGRRIVDHVRRAGKGRVLQVERRHNLSPQEFRTRYLRRGIPVILEGAGRDWTCSREWTFDNFRKRFGAETIKLVQRKGVAPDDEVIDTREFSEEIVFSEFLDQVLNGGRKYMRFSPLLEQFPELLEDFDQQFLQGMPGNNFGTTYQLFIGGAGTFTPLHNAITPFFFVNICGVKRWQFIPNTYLGVLDPSPEGLTYNYSGADVGMSNLDRYPGFDCIDRMEAEMQPGDILYNPSWMWHCAQNASPTIGVRCGFVYPFGMLRESLTLTSVRAFAGNPSMLKTAWYSFFKTNLPERDTLLVTPKVFTKPAAARNDRRANGA